MSAGPTPQTFWGPELTALPRPHSWFQGSRLAAGGDGGEGSEGLGEGKREGRRKWGMGKGGEKREVWGNSALVVGGIDAPVGEYA